MSPEQCVAAIAAFPKHSTLRNFGITKQVASSAYSTFPILSILRLILFNQYAQENLKAVQNLKLEVNPDSHCTAYPYFRAPSLACAN